MNSNEQGSDSLFEEPQILNALFKYSILQSEQLRFKSFRAGNIQRLSYQPDVNVARKILNERNSPFQNKQDILESGVQKKLCSLEPHEKLQRMLLQTNCSTFRPLESSLETINATQPILNPFEQTQKLVQQIEQLTSEFIKGNVYKCDQDADLKELENKFSDNGAQSVRENNPLGSSDNLSNPNNKDTQDVLRYIQKRSRRPRADQIVKKVKEDTKNLLRNYGNAQSRFILNNIYSKKKMDQHFENSQDKIEDFKKWVQQQKLENFEQFKNIWYVQQDELHQEYKELFREICFDFYENHASVYVLGSQMRSEDTRKTHIKYICRFLEGIVDPSSFYYFKKN